MHLRHALLAVLGLTLLLSAPRSAAQAPTYEANCITNVDNETIVLSSSIERTLPNGRSIAEGDTLALYTEGGTCAGYGVWRSDGSTVTLAAAGPSSIADSVSGYGEDEPLKFEVYDVSADTIIDLGTAVSYRSCDRMDLSPCRDDGTYATGALTMIDALSDEGSSGALASFEVEGEGSRVVLSWTTAKEDGNAGFDVLHRSAGASTWTTLSFIPGAGTSTRPQSYRYRTDELGFGTHSFRLRQVDEDGTSSLSQTVEVDLVLDDSFALSGVYPNPVRATGSIDLAVKETQAVTVRIFDLLGRQVRTVFDERLEANRTRTIRVNSSRLASGAYFLRVRGETFAETRRLTVVK